MIGTWRNEGCILGFLPKCLKNGENPSPFSSGNFPIYNGPNANQIITSELLGGAEYNDGVVNFDGTDDLILTNWFLPALSEITVLCWFNCTLPENREIVGGVGPLLSSERPWTSNYQIDMRVAGSKFRTRVYQADDVGMWKTVPYRTQKTNPPFYWNNGADRFFVMSWGSGVHDCYYVDLSGDVVKASTEDFDMDTSLVGSDMESMRASEAYLKFGAQLNASGNPEVGVGPWQWFYKGNMQGTLIYNKKLTLQEIRDIYALGSDLGGLELYDNGNGTGYFQIEPSSGESESSAYGTIPSGGDGVSILGESNSFSNPDEDRYVT
jgi:hypothetical protein